MTETDIQNALFRYFNAYRGYTYQLCNAYVYTWESDFFCIASSGYTYEIEVKTSRTDFFNDFNKTEKHSILGSPFDAFNKPLGRNSDIVPNLDKWEYREDGFWHYENHELNKHVRKKPPVCKFKRVSLIEAAPNKFYYAVPKGLITQADLPDYAGLIYVVPDGRRKPKIVVRPPTLHTHKQDHTATLLKKYYWAYLNSLGHKKHGKNFRFPDENRKRMVRTK